MASSSKDRDKNFEKNAIPKDRPRRNYRARAIQEAIKTANKPGDPITVSFGEIELRLSDVHLLRGPRSLNGAIVAFYFSFLQHDRYRCNSDMVFVPPDTTQCMVEMEADGMEPLYIMYELNVKLFGFFVFRDDHGDSGVTASNGNNGGGSGSGGAGVGGSGGGGGDVVGGCNTANHFSLVVFSRPDKAFYYFSSCGKKTKRPSDQTQNFVKELAVVMNCTHWQLKSIRSNVILHTSYDCGIRILCMTDNVANHVNRYERIEGIEPLQQDSVSAKRTEMLKLIYILGGKIAIS